jgi:signal transduction histidine kinase
LSQFVHPDTDVNPPGSVPDSQRDRIWAGLIGFAFVVSMAAAYRPSFASPLGILLAVLPWIVLAGLVAAWAARSFAMRLWGFGVAVAGWSVLVLDDERWSMLSFALFGLCFIVDSTRLTVGVTLAGIVAAVWTIASLGGPLWTVFIPAFVFVAASTIAYAIQRIGRLTAKQAALIAELKATQDDLAASERSRGVLEERTRMAGEIHDTLAQGFASIVLLARAGKRTTERPEDALESIEATAQESLDTARRLVASTGPDELQEVSLPDALKRHLEDSLPEGVDGEMRVVGQPRPLRGAAETLLLRSAQEGLRNAYTHAQPERVDLTLTYRGDEVALDIRDDGVGFVDGRVNDRGSLTGGQGLTTLARRLESINGELNIEPGPESGCVLTVRIPST